MLLRLVCERLDRHTRGRSSEHVPTSAHLHAPTPSSTSPARASARGSAQTPVVLRARADAATRRHAPTRPRTRSRTRSRSRPACGRLRVREAIGGDVQSPPREGALSDVLTTVVVDEFHVGEVAMLPAEIAAHVFRVARAPIARGCPRPALSALEQHASDARE